MRSRWVLLVAVAVLLVGGGLFAASATGWGQAGDGSMRIQGGCDALEARTDERCDDDGDHVPCDEMEHMLEWQCRGPVASATPPAASPAPAG